MSEARRLFRRLYLNRRAAYNNCFRGDDGTINESGNIVLADLRKFCRATTTTFVPGDSHATARNEGRREAYTRILSYLQASEAEVFRAVETLED